jgi:hypothetical protein
MIKKTWAEGIAMVANEVLGGEDRGMVRTKYSHHDIRHAKEDEVRAFCDIASKAFPRDQHGDK